MWSKGVLVGECHTRLLLSPLCLRKSSAVSEGDLRQLKIQDSGSCLNACALLCPQGQASASQVPPVGQCVHFPASNCCHCQGRCIMLHSLPYPLPGLFIILNFVGLQKGGCASFLSPRKAPVSWGLFDSFIWAALFVLCAVLAAQMGGN